MCWLITEIPNEPINQQADFVARAFEVIDKLGFVDFGQAFGGFDLDACPEPVEGTTLPSMRKSARYSPTIMFLYTT